MSENHEPRPQFRSGWDGMRRAQDEHDVRLGHDLISIRHAVELVEWPQSATSFVHRVLSYFPDDGTSEDLPDWTASELLEFVIKDLAKALEEASSS